MVGGGRRTRTFEVIRRLIYSQLPLPLGTLPRSTASEPIRRNGGNKAMDDVKTGRRWRAPGWRVYDGRAIAKSTNWGALIAPLWAPNCHYPEPVRQACDERSRPKAAVSAWRRQGCGQAPRIRPPD